MYLEFIKDIFQLNDYICIECGNEKTEGFIVKISSELIAIKTSAGIVIKKDADITDIYSIDKAKERDKHEGDTEANNHIVVESNSNASVTKKNMVSLLILKVTLLRIW